MCVYVSVMCGWEVHAMGGGEAVNEWEGAGRVLLAAHDFSLKFCYQASKGKNVTWKKTMSFWIPPRPEAAGRPNVHSLGRDWQTVYAGGHKAAQEGLVETFDSPPPTTAVCGGKNPSVPKAPKENFVLPNPRALVRVCAH